MATSIEDVLKIMRVDKAVRRAIVRRSFLLFFCYYFSDYMEYAFAPFHYEWFNLAQHDDHSMWVITGFRNSGKSSIFSLTYIIWLIISGKAKYVLLVSENQQKAQTLLGHIRTKLEADGLLKDDLGPFQEERASWNSVSLVIQNYNSKITAVSIEQSVRGMRHRNHRPDLIVLDDCESSESVKTIEMRDKLSKWLSGDVIPAGHSDTRTIVIGSMLHIDSLIPRLQRKIDDGKIDGIYHSTPIIDAEGNSTWLARYPDAAAIEHEKKRGTDEREWRIEFLLQPPIEDDQVIKESDIHYYDHLPEIDGNVHTAVDLAFTEGARSDFTAIVSGVIVWEGDEWYLYILPHPVNERLVGAAQIDRIIEHSLVLGNGHPTPVYVEEVGAQKIVIELLQKKGIPAEGVSPGGNDKRARFSSASWIIKTRVRWPCKGCEMLKNQMLFFGAERHDDLLDALVYLVVKVFEKMEKGRILIPRNIEKPPKEIDRAEEESWADKGTRLSQEAQRSGDQFKWQLYNQWQSEDNQRRPEYGVERLRFNREMVGARYRRF